MIPQQIQKAQETVANLCQQAEVQDCVEPFLLQALMAVIDLLPQEIQPGLEHLVDISRQRRGIYGAYVTIRPDQLDHEQVLSLHQQESGALHLLEQVRRCDVPARIAYLSLTTSPLPHTHKLAQAQEEKSFAVLIPETIDRKAILAQLYPQLRDHNTFGAKFAAYDRQLQR